MVDQYGTLASIETTTTAGRRIDFETVKPGWRAGAKLRAKSFYTSPYTALCCVQIWNRLSTMTNVLVRPKKVERVRS